MKRRTLAVPSAVALIATIIALNALGAAALPASDEETDARLVQNHDSSDPTSTPVAPMGTIQEIIGQQPRGLIARRALEPASSGPPLAEARLQLDDRAQQAKQGTKNLQLARGPFAVADQGMQPAVQILPQARSGETCFNMIWNSQMDVVEFGDGTGSIEFWSIMDAKIYYDSEIYNSPHYSLVMIDETDGTDPVLIDIGGEIWDYDQFGQGFQAPTNLTYLRVSYSRLYADANPTDAVWSNLWTLDNDGYLDELIVWVPIGEDQEGWSDRYWELDSSGLAKASGKTLAVVFDMLSDMAVPGEWIWLDDVQVTLCFDVGQYGVYLPLVAKQPPTPSQPTCSPREPDSLTQPGSTARDATCGGSFSPVDQKDYYLLDLRGERKVRLRLFNLPPGTNWDALIYENTGGYPLACQIGTPGSGDKSVDCNLNLSKDYFVLVSRGPEKTGGSYGMRVEAR